MKTYEATLLDLSDGNIAVAKRKAEEYGVNLKTAVGDARDTVQVLKKEGIGYGEVGYDHVFLMGPLYHLQKEEERVKAVEEALRMLKPGGVLYVSFIAMFASILYFMQNDMAQFCIEDPDVEEFKRCDLAYKSYAGNAFTQAYFAQQKEILPFMERFGMEKLHFFGQEGIFSPCDEKFRSQPKEVQKVWLDYAEELCEREELISYSEHLMYIGRKVK